VSLGSIRVQKEMVSFTDITSLNENLSAEYKSKLAITARYVTAIESSTHKVPEH